MSSSQLTIICIACLVSITTALPGIFLLLRKVSLMSDAISHSVLLGIVLAFFWVKDLSSPYLFCGAVASSFCMVIATEWFIRTKQVAKDTAIGMTFPLFFALAILLINCNIRNVHLDIDSVLLGELAFAPFNRLILWGRDLGPQAVWTMGIIFLLNLTLFTLFYKELTLSTFDPEFARVVGISSKRIHYSLMLLTTITIVGAFDCVGAILVVALMIAIPSTAYLLSGSVLMMFWLSIGIGILNSLLGYFLAASLNGSIAGAIATTSGFTFLAIILIREVGQTIQSLCQKRHLT